jgi:DNA-binding PadR family transcriptional regulator
MSVRHALLTLLSQGPRHGYQLKVEFDRATGEAWPLNFGQVYTTLQRLDKAGLVEALGSQNDKNLYCITDAGRADIDQWLATPVTQPLATRDELSIKILVAVATGYTDPVSVVDRQRNATIATLQSVTKLRAEPESDDAGASGHGVAWLLHLDRMAMMAESELRWLDLVEDRLATLEFRPAHGNRAPVDHADAGTGSVVNAGEGERPAHSHSMERS